MNVQALHYIIYGSYHVQDRVRTTSFHMANSHGWRQKQDRCYYHERLCVAASHTHCFRYWGNHRQRRSQTFYPYLPTRSLTVYIISFLPKPLHTALIVSAKDNILTNSLTSNSHGIKTVLSIDVCLDSEDWFVFIASLFFVSPCVITVVCHVLTFSFLNFLRSCNSVPIHAALNSYTWLTWPEICTQRITFAHFSLPRLMRRTWLGGHTHTSSLAKRRRR